MNNNYRLLGFKIKFGKRMEAELCPFCKITNSTHNWFRPYGPFTKKQLFTAPLMNFESTALILFSYYCGGIATHAVELFTTHEFRL